MKKEHVSYFSLDRWCSLIIKRMMTLSVVMLFLEVHFAYFRIVVKDNIILNFIPKNIFHNRTKSSEHARACGPMA